MASLFLSHELCFNFTCYLKFAIWETAYVFSRGGHIHSEVQVVYQAARCFLNVFIVLLESA